MATQLSTTREYRDKKIAQQKEVMRHLFPTQKINIPAASGNNPGTADYQLVVGSDADFHILGITGSYGFLYPKDPTSPESQTNPVVAHPAPQDGAVDVGIRITDASSGKLITDGFVGLDLFLSPGAVGNTLEMIYEMDHIVTRAKNLRLELVNYDTDPAIVNIVFHGRKYFC